MKAHAMKAHGMNIDGHTKLIPHLGYPTASFKAPMIYNPWFEAQGINAVVVPMGVTPQDAPVTLPAVFRMSNFHGALDDVRLYRGLLTAAEVAALAKRDAGARK